MTDRERLIDIITDYADFLPWETIDDMADSIMESFAKDTNVPSWIPVTERLPEEDVRVLVWIGDNRGIFPMIDTDRIDNGRWVRWDGYITHWMPLPEAPKGE